MGIKIGSEKLQPEISTLDGQGHRLSLVIADFGSKVVMDLPLGKLVCNLNTRVSGVSREPWYGLTSSGTSALIIN